MNHQQKVKKYAERTINKKTRDVSWKASNISCKDNMIIMSGGDLLSLKDILGHKDLEMVQRYSHIASNYKRKMVNKLKGKFSICQLFVTSDKIIPFEQKK